jgi:phytoene desaturase
MSRRLVVIGGGIAGLSAALTAARRGFRVTLLEKNRSLGGKLHERWVGPYRFDAGPSLVTFPHFFEEMLGVGRLTFQRVEPHTYYFFPDGLALTLYHDAKRQAEEIGTKLGTEAVGRWQNYLTYARRLYERAAPVFLQLPIHDVGTLLRSALFWRHLPYLPLIDGHRRMHEAAEKILRYAPLVQIADRYSTFVGGNPYTLPATFHLISWVENGLGNHHIKGGLYQIVRAFEEALQEAGVTIFLETPARRIHLRGKRPAAVETRNGLIDADAIIVATDHTYAQQSLLGRKTYPTPKQSLSGLVFLWGVEGVSPFGHHNILFSGDYAGEFAAIAAGRLDYEPTVYVCISARTDSADAPAGSENWFVLLNVPPVGSAWREEDTMRFRERAIRRIRQVWGAFEPERIRAEAVITPAEWASMHYSTGGSLYGMAPEGILAAFRRPANCDPYVKGLYYASGTVHPGGGLPLSLKSGQIAAHLAAQDLLSKRIWVKKSS